MHTQQTLVIYTCLFGDSEPLGDPTIGLLDSSTDLDVTFICITDNHELESNVWSFKYLDDKHLPKGRLSRKAKMLPHLFFQDHQFSLYVDNIVQFKRLPNSKDLTGLCEEAPIALFAHRSRSLPIQEAEAVIGIGYDSATTICNQFDFYNTQKIDARFLATCTVIYRAHHAQRCIKFGEIWWEQYLSYSKRDQISFPYACTLSDVNPIFLDGYAEDCDLIFTPAQLSVNRIRSNFDSKKYAWRNRETLGNTDAVNHFLTYSNQHATYAAKENMLEFYAFVENSPLGNFHSPRRDLCSSLDKYLSHSRTIAGHGLYISGDAGVNSFSTPNSISNLRVFSRYFPSIHFTALSVPHSLQSHAKIDESLKNSSFNFDIYIFTDICGKLINEIPKFLLKSINRDSHQGFFAIFGTNPMSTDTVRRISDTIELLLDRPIECTLLHSRHDSSDHYIHHSALLIQWR